MSESWKRVKTEKVFLSCPMRNTTARTQETPLTVFLTVTTLHAHSAPNNWTQATPGNAFGAFIAA